MLSPIKKDNFGFYLPSNGYFWTITIGTATHDGYCGVAGQKCRYLRESRDVLFYKKNAKVSNETIVLFSVNHNKYNASLVQLWSGLFLGITVMTSSPLPIHSFRT